jgi:hypothetical protein
VLQNTLPNLPGIELFFDQEPVILAGKFLKFKNLGGLDQLINLELQPENRSRRFCVDKWHNILRYCKFKSFRQSDQTFTTTRFNSQFSNALAALLE